MDLELLFVLIGLLVFVILGAFAMPGRKAHELKVDKKIKHAFLEEDALNAPTFEDTLMSPSGHGMPGNILKDILVSPSGDGIPGNIYTPLKRDLD